MAIGKLLGKGVGRMFGDAANKGRTRFLPEMKEDVVKSQKKDLEAIRRARNIDDEPNVRGAAKQSVEAAGKRSVTSG